MSKHGIIVLNKPSGMTSHSCVGKVRRLAGTKKVGHTGTLDPAVTGVLPICIGQATRVAEYILDYDKEYVATIVLGRSTATEDQTGETIEEAQLEEAPTLENVQEKIQNFIGEIEQIPPMFSAVKIDGVRLHKLARQGKEVERKARKVMIYDIELLQYTPELPYPTIKLRVRCSKGTYIRTLGVDLGRALGYPAHMSSLVRTKSGPFTLEDCVTFDELEGWNEEQWQNEMLPLEKAIAHLPDLIVSGDLKERVLFGQSLVIEQQVENDQLYRVLDQNGRFLAIYEGNHPKLIKPRKVFHME
ncbi:tRNA pseudouridine(55) synthase TruB [Bacillus horti]|uniref:tRNA pseudouridine synthase B n=1 Tax=Caldalkalibacillus horti TaxID=77523 RepID=A0ABT9VUQ7_9BACI|nr:tRNA pseudouridine(55) synthase TruB [Bacillus horti]MDQ0164711.1 tRNA pseudouridine55 synthase [Bacillus horti]